MITFKYYRNVYKFYLFLLCILFSCQGYSSNTNHATKYFGDNAKLTNAKKGGMKLDILQIGDPLLRAQARQLSKKEILSPEIKELITLMQSTLRAAPGVGLAAPQVGFDLAIAVIEDKKEYMKNLSPSEIKLKERKVIPFHVIINPKITLLENPGYIDFFESCLSVGLTAQVPRANEVKVEYLNEKAEPCTVHARGWYARILQHEIDHLHGIVNIDRMKSKTLSTLDNYKKYNLGP